MSNKLIYILLPLSLVFDVLTETVFEKGGTLAIIKASFYYSIIFYTFIQGFKRRDSVNLVFVIFLFYVAIQIPYAREPIESLKVSLKVLMSILMFPFGYYYINSFKKLQILNSSVIAMMMIYIFNYIISQYYGIGVSVYTNEKEFVVGNLSDNWNIITYILLVVPAILLTTKRKKVLFFLSLILIILLIISLKRIAILGVLVGYSIYIFKSKNVLKSSRIFVLLFLLFFAISPLISPILNKRIESRGDKLSGSVVSILENETRYLETIAVFSEIFSFESPIKVLFGGEAFYSRRNYGDVYFFRDRQIHIDYNLILNTIGVIGFLLYLNVFYYIYRKRNRIKRYIEKNTLFKKLDTIFLMLFFSQFITSFGGQMYVFTFRGIIFIYLGSILGIMYRSIYEEVKSKDLKITSNNFL